MHPLPTLAAALAAGLGSAAAAQPADPVPQGSPNTDFQPASPEQTRAPQAESGVSVTTETVAEGLVHPWGIDSLPDGGYLVTERPGQLVHVSEDGEVSPPISGVPEVLNLEQGGLLDVKVGPDFANDRRVYFTYSKPLGENLSATAAARGVLSEDLTSLSQVEDIFVQEPGSPSPMHYGSRIVFDGEGHAFVTTGEHFTEAERQNAQKMDTTYGKIVRVGLDGSVPDDNPFGGEDGIGTIWSLGHRNIQSAAIDPATGELWVVEHGPKGGDELNRVTSGANYGWPVVSYGVNYDGSPVGSGKAAHAPEGFEEPVYYWDPVIAPGDMTFYDGEMVPDWTGDVLIAGLISQGVVRLDIEDGRVVGEERLDAGGRVRDVHVAPDGSLLLLIDAEAGSILRMSVDGAS